MLQLVEELCTILVYILALSGGLSDLDTPVLVHTGPELYHPDRSAANNYGFQAVGSQSSDTGDTEDCEQDEVWCALSMYSRRNRTWRMVAHILCCWV